MAALPMPSGCRLLPPLLPICCSSCCTMLPKQRKPPHTSSQRSDTLSFIASRCQPLSAESSGGKDLSPCHRCPNSSSPCDANTVPDSNGLRPGHPRGSCQLIIEVVSAGVGVADQPH